MSRIVAPLVEDLLHSAVTEGGAKGVLKSEAAAAAEGMVRPASKVAIPAMEDIATRAVSKGAVPSAEGVVGAGRGTEAAVEDVLRPTTPIPTPPPEAQPFASDPFVTNRPVSRPGAKEWNPNATPKMVENFYTANGIDRDALHSKIKASIDQGLPIDEAITENFRGLSSHLTDDAARATGVMANAMEDALNVVRGPNAGGVLSNKEVAWIERSSRELAEAAGINGIDHAADIGQQNSKAMYRWASEMLTVKVGLKTAANKVGDIYARLKTSGSNLDRLEALFWLDKYGDLMGSFLGMQANHGRAVRVLASDTMEAVSAAGMTPKQIEFSASRTNLKGVRNFFERNGLGNAIREGGKKGLSPTEVIKAAAEDGRLNGDDLTELLDANGGAKAVDRSIGMIKAAGDDIIKVSNVMKANKWLSSINEFHINALISGPQGAIVDAISNGIKTYLLPGEKILGGVLGMDKNAINDGLATYSALMQYNMESLRGMAAALRAGEPILERGAGAMENLTHSITGSNWGLNPESWASDAVDYFGTTVRLPSRLRMGMDEFYKQLNFRSFAHKELLKMGMEQGIAPNMIGQFVADGLKMATSSGALQGPEGPLKDTVRGAIQYAREATYQARLTGFTGDVAKLLNRHPASKLFVPFVRTPINIVKDVVIRTPALELLRKATWQDIAAGGTKRADVLGRMATGSLLWGAGITLALSGIITGSGPKNKDQAAAQRGDGWQPYSVVLKNDDGTNTYVKYGRLDPFGMFLGIAADWVEMAHGADEQSNAELAGSMSLALAHNLTSKTYLAGLSQLLDAVNDPSNNRNWKFVNNFFAGFVPAVARSIPIDPYMRETRSIADTVLSRIPGLSNTLPPKFNALGEPVANINGLGANFINPFTVTTSTGDPVNSELATMSHGLSGLNTRLAGLDTRSYTNEKGLDAHTFANEHLANDRFGGKTLRQELQSLISSRGYQAMPGADSPDGLEPTGRLAALRRIFSDRHARANQAMLKAFPKLSEDYHKILTEKAAGAAPSTIANGRLYSQIHP